MTARVVAVDVGGTGVRACAYGVSGLEGDVARAPLDRTLRREELLDRIVGDVDVDVVPAALGAEATLIGAGELALDGAARTVR